MTRKEIEKIRRKANAIAANYCRGYIEASVIQDMYKELNAIGVTVGMITGDAQEGQKTCEWYINDEEVPNSYFCYRIHKGSRESRIEFIEYNIYFS